MYAFGKLPGLAPEQEGSRGLRKWSVVLVRWLSNLHFIYSRELVARERRKKIFFPRGPLIDPFIITRNINHLQHVQ